MPHEVLQQAVGSSSSDNDARFRGAALQPAWGSPGKMQILPRGSAGGRGLAMLRSSSGLLMLSVRGARFNPEEPP